LGFGQIDVLHSRERTVADTESFVEPLRRATAIWLAGGDQSRLAAAYGGTLVEQVLQERLRAGAVIGGTSAGAAIACRVMIAGGRETPQLATGFDLLPAAIVDQHVSQRQRLGRLQAAVERHPQCVGVGIDESTALVVHQRQLRILGEGRVHLCFSPSAYAEAEHVELRPGQRGLDWTTIVRSNRERHLPPFPPATIPADKLAEGEVPVALALRRDVPHGSLLIVGGGGATNEIWATFVERAGGPAARIVVLPTAVPAAELDRTGNRSGEARVFRRLGVADVQVLPQTDVATVSSDEFCRTLSQATGIWFGGGRQWRFVDTYEQTPAVAAMRECLRRGGIIGGSSAGASIQGELLIRGAPVGNQIMVQDGYRRGFGFLPGVGIDQHFAQRNRFRDLEQTIRRFPSILGVGIDESTALLVERSQGRVLGRGAVYFYSAGHLAAQPADLAVAERPIKVEPGQTIDLNLLQIPPQK
jgi:cyanophycinase